MRKLLLLVVAALLALLPACGGGRSSAPSADKVVERTTTATAKVKSFHFVLDVQHAPINPGGLSLAHADGDVRVPGAMQARFAGSLSGIGLKSALVFVGGQYYLRDPFSGKWRTLDANTNPVKFFNPAKGVLAIIKGAQGLTVTGSQKVAGTDCWRLVGKVPIRSLTYVLGSPPSAKLVPVEIWVAKGDSVLRKVLLDGPVNEGDGPGVARTLVISRLDERVDIKAPEVAKS